MKILIFSWEYPPHMVGGLGQHVYDLSRFLVARGESVHIITPRVKGSPDLENQNGVVIHRVGSPNSEEENFKSWTFAFNSEVIREAIRINAEVGGFNLVHAHDWLVAYAGRSVSKIFELPLVTTIHATEHGRNLGLYNRTQLEIHEIEKNLAMEADRIICCSKYMQEEICSLFGVHQDNVVIIPNGVEPEQFITLPEQPRINIGSEDRVVFFIGRLVPEKGIWQLISCFPRVLKSVPEARLFIGGRGPQKPILEKRVMDLGLSDKVVFTGFIRDSERNYVYNRASVAVFPSIYEPFGIVALEAMATKTPVVVSDVGGLSEIVKDEHNGLKVPPANEKALADAIIRILEDQELHNRLVKNASNEIESTYNWDNIARDTIDVYKNTSLITHNRKEVV